MTGRGQEQVLGLLQLLGRGDVTEVQHLLAAAAQPGAEQVDPAAVGELVGQLLAWLGQRERRAPAGGQLRRQAGQPVRGRIPLPDQAVGVQHRDAVRAGVDHRALVRSLPDDLLERGHVGQCDAGVAGQQLEQLKLDVADLAPAVQRVQRADTAARPRATG